MNIRHLRVVAFLLAFACLAFFELSSAFGQEHQRGRTGEVRRAESARKATSSESSAKQNRRAEHSTDGQSEAAQRRNSRDVAVSGEAHANKVDGRPATLYEKYDRNGEFQKHGVTKHENPSKRYSQKQIGGGEVVRVERGPRDEMIKKERERVETNPGPENKEPWAGKKRIQ